MVDLVPKELRIIKSIEYCSIERAALLLGVELEDIYQWILNDTIRACVYVSGVRGAAQYESMIYLNDNDGAIEKNELLTKFEQEQHPRSHIQTLGLVHNQDNYFSNVSISAYIGGLWAVSFGSSLINLLLNDDDSVEVLLKSLPVDDLEGYQPILSRIGYIGFGSVEVYKDELVIYNRDLEALHNMLHSENYQALPNRWGYNSTKNNSIAEITEETIKNTATKSEMKKAKRIEFAYKIYDEFAFDSDRNKIITSAAKWAETVLEHCHRVSEWRDNEPLSKDRLTRELSPFFKVKEEMECTK